MLQIFSPFHLVNFYRMRRVIRQVAAVNGSMAREPLCVPSCRGGFVTDTLGSNTSVPFISINVFKQQTGGDVPRAQTTFLSFFSFRFFANLFETETEATARHSHLPPHVVF